MQDEIVMLKTGERISEVISAELSDRLNGEMVLDIRTAMKRITAPSVKDRIQFMGQVFNVVSVERTIANGAFLIDISAEHASFSLADEEFDFEEFKYEGSASGALTRILSGTGFDGSVEVSIDSSVFFNRTGAVNRRTLLMDLCSMTGGELEYSGYTIRIAAHRGSAARYVINRRYPVADFTAAETESAVSYEMTTDRADGISVGDNVTIQLTEPFHVEADVRVIGITYNPFYRKTAVIQMGDYRQDIVSDIVDDKEDTDDLWESLKDYLKLDDVSTSIGAYIDSEDGSKKIEEALSGTYQTIDGMGNYVQTVNLNTSITEYINTAAGTAAIVAAAKGTYQTISGMGNYVQTANLNTSIGQYIDTSAGTAKIISAASGTYQTISGMGNYVQTANLNTSIGQYIDTSAGTAKIVSAASGTYQTKSGMSDYAKVSAVTSVEQSVSNVEAAITLSAVYSKNTIGTNVYALIQLVSNPNSSTIKIKADKIDFEGFTTFLRASDIGSGGATTIDGGRIKTGTISADRIDVDNLKVTTIYGKGTYSSYTAMTTDGTNLYIGGSSFSASYSNIYLAVKTKVYFGNQSVFSICIDTDSDSIYSTYSASQCGTSLNPWGSLYVGSSSYYWKITYSAIIPNTSTT